MERQRAASSCPPLLCRRRQPGMSSGGDTEVRARGAPRRLGDSAPNLADDRKRPPTRLKSRRRLPPPASVCSSSDDNKSSGHASLSESGQSTPGTRRGRDDALEELRRAMERMAARSRSSYSTSSLSSGSTGRRPDAAADEEFVWVDGRSRLVELQKPPWSTQTVLAAVRGAARLGTLAHRFSLELVPRLSYLLQRPLVRVAREAQRFSSPRGACGRRDIVGALRVVLPGPLADSCVQAGHRAAALFSGGPRSASKSSRAGLHLPVGRFHRWMCESRLAGFVHEYAALYLCAAIESLLEEVVLLCLPPGGPALTSSLLEAAIAASPLLWGLFQPFSHLNSGRNAAGVLSVPPTGEGPCSPGDTAPAELLTTCVATLAELGELVAGATRSSVAWTPGALQSLFYFTRCSHHESRLYERPHGAAPPLAEWVRVAAAHAAHRRSPVADQDDVLQAARLLLPGVDCPVRPDWGPEERLYAPSADTAGQLQTELGFRMVCSSRADLVAHGLQLLPRLDWLDPRGLSPLMVASVQGDEALVQTLLGHGASPDVECPGPTAQCPAANPDTQHWTALTFATAQGHYAIAKLMLDKGACVEGGAELHEEKATETPLQLAAAAGRTQLVELLLSRGARPFLSTAGSDSQTYGGAPQRGCHSAIAAAASHGQRAVVHLLLSHPTAAHDILSLEEILAEGVHTAERRIQIVPVSMEDLDKVGSTMDRQVVKMTRAQLKALQEAMYQSAENTFLEITLDLRNLGVPWSLHCWLSTLATAHDRGLETVVDQLLRDFLQGWPEDGPQFGEEGLPLLFSIFRHCKKEETLLLLADLFSRCYGPDPIKDIPHVSFVGGPRIDPKYVNNPEMSDIQFRVEGRLFYGHRIILVNASPKFQALMAGAGSQAVVVNDIRYHVFQLVMEYLYKGGCEDFLQLEQTDVLELMAAADFFQLDGLTRLCEVQCSRMLDADNAVSMYIHAKVYGATHLLEYCRGFLLQHLVALLSYDDSLRRLLFGKRLPNHDVLSGLLLTLQARHRERSRPTRNAAV